MPRKLTTINFGRFFTIVSLFLKIPFKPNGNTTITTKVHLYKFNSIGDRKLCAALPTMKFPAQKNGAKTRNSIALFMDYQMLSKHRSKTEWMFGGSNRGKRIQQNQVPGWQLAVQPRFPGPTVFQLQIQRRWDGFHYPAGFSWATIHSAQFRLLHIERAASHWCCFFLQKVIQPPPIKGRSVTLSPKSRICVKVPLFPLIYTEPTSCCLMARCCNRVSIVDPAAMATVVLLNPLCWRGLYNVTSISISYSRGLIFAAHGNEWAEKLILAPLAGKSQTRVPEIIFMHDSRIMYFNYIPKIRAAIMILQEQRR